MVTEISHLLKYWFGVSPFMVIIDAILCLLVKTIVDINTTLWIQYICVLYFENKNVNFNFNFHYNNAIVTMRRVNVAKYRSSLFSNYSYITIQNKQNDSFNRACITWMLIIISKRSTKYSVLTKHIVFKLLRFHVCNILRW